MILTVCWRTLLLYMVTYLFFTHILKPCLEHHTMSLDQYNRLMSDMLNERCTLTKLRAELEGREGRICQKCGRFRHLVWKCQSGEE